MHCAPPAVRALYENEIFTRLTATGKPQPSDQAMEKSVKHVRRHMGKVDQGRVMEKKMEYTCSEIPNRAPEENVRRELREGSSTFKSSCSTGDEWLRENSPLIQGFRLIHREIQLWHHTNQPIIRRGADRAPIFSKPNSYELPKKETLNPQVLVFDKIGTKLAIDYLKMYYIMNPYTVERSEKKVPLTKILANTLDKKCELKIAMDKVTSVIYDDLDKATNKDEAGELLNRVIDQLNGDASIISMVPPVALYKMNKRERIIKLIEYRRLYFRKNKEEPGWLTIEARQAFGEKYPAFSQERRLEDLYTNKMYCLSEEVLCSERYRSSINN
ncbi:hypothetical protein ACHAXR_001297 [Thalassiosira sp. AJA248-18]